MQRSELMAVLQNGITKLEANGASYNGTIDQSMLPRLVSNASNLKKNYKQSNINDITFFDMRENAWVTVKIEDVTVRG